MRLRIFIKMLRFVGIILFMSLAIWAINRYGVTQLRAQVEQWGLWAPAGIFGLRFISVVIPALPGTAYSILSGGLLGFGQGIWIICLADLLSCSLSFFLSRRFGRHFIQRFVGKAFMNRIDAFSQRHLERNFFLMTGCLMTGFFDFVCYGLGLTTAPWTKFLPALVISIAISNPPFVALGAGVLEGGPKLLVFALLGIFGLAIATSVIQKSGKLTDKSD